MNLTNRHSLPESIVLALEKAESAYSAGASDATVSSLHEPPRMVLLKKQGELTSDVSERLASLLGTAFHHVMELAAVEGDVVEERYFTEVLGWTISGQIDAYTPADAHLKDYKVISVWAVTVGSAVEEYTKKLNTYAYILRQNGLKVDKLSIIVFFRDWKAREARRDQNYPQQQVIEYDLDVWPAEKAREHVFTRVEIHQAAVAAYDMDKALPECTPEDKWAKSEKWAVYKGANKRATKLCDSKVEARAYVGSTTQGMRIEKRPGEATRCMHWCPVRTVCSVGKELEMAAEAAF